MQGFDPLIIFYLAILIMSAVIHEVSHGMAAFILGDPTAKYADRLTLNPIKHLDLFGSLILPFIFRLSGEYATFSNLVLAIVQINIWLALFNLVPIPPLDGSKLLFSLLSPRFYNLERAMEQYGFFILIILIFILPGILFIPLGALASIILQLLLGS